MVHRIVDIYRAGIVTRVVHTLGDVLVGVAEKAHVLDVGCGIEPEACDYLMLCRIDNDGVEFHAAIRYCLDVELGRSIDLDLGRVNREEVRTRSGKTVSTLEDILLEVSSVSLEVQLAYRRIL